ncbi:AraC family transcriptional regulator [Aneurinibacillus aneurinilyticus]|uniref:helix-turn-helix transcriptional regulator n=1 Tax=Aneurinibacillus aneurinilyticus TaxID=1391 RepID=UPI002E1A4242|nr:AraC family transcriptional regulator [Aneurinibacillus aneurinilyticus]
MGMTDFHQNFNRFFDELQLQRQRADRTEKMALHPQMGEGAIQRFVPRPDLEIVISKYKLYQKHKANIFTEAPMVELNYCLQGRRKTVGSDFQHEFAPGNYTLQFTRQVDACFELNEHQPLLMLSIGLPVSTFHRFMEELNGTRTIDFSHILGRHSFRIFQNAIDPSASVILKQILRAAERHDTKNFEIECGALELLSLAFQSFLFDDKQELSILSKSDMQKIRQAREILLERMTNPPTLVELSRLIHLNDYNLKIGFKEIYGMTVFSYLRNKRLEKAFFLLQNGSMNVNEVSCAVGYSNPSYFAEAFRKQFGCNPGEFTRRF